MLIGKHASELYLVQSLFNGLAFLPVVYPTIAPKHLEF
jgi:hypothetical protein